MPETELRISHPLIPRKILFGNITAYGGQISPDGAWLSWIAPVDAVQNIWLAPSHNLAAAKPLTHTKGRPISWHFWTKDSRNVLFLNDEIGDEKNHLFIVDSATGTLRDLTPIAGVSVFGAHVSHQITDTIIVAINDRDASWFDYYAIDTLTGTRTLVWHNTQKLTQIGFDWQLKPRWAKTARAGGGERFFKIAGEALIPWFETDFEDAWNTTPLDFHDDNTRVLMKSSVGRNTLALSWHNLDTGEETPIAAHDKYDVAEHVTHPVSQEVLAACVNGLRHDWIFIAADVKDDFAFLQATFKDLEIFVQSQSADNEQWIVNTYGPQQASVEYLYNRGQKTLREVCRARPELDAYRLAPMHPVVIPSRDGLELVSYLSLPPEIASDRPPTPLPLVLYVHGGPWSRDIYGFYRYHHWLTNRGYAVLSVNYRASTGFGKAFLAAGEKEHARKMHEDLLDAVSWAVREGIADKDKVAIFGYSYGGYASYVGATFTPDVFCCSVPVVGISHLRTLLENRPPYWEDFAEYAYRSYGDLRTEEGSALLEERSPLNRVDAITKPMFILHGANDVRCTLAQSNLIVAAMQARHIPVSYVVFPDEGHGFAKPENNIASIAMIEAFFAKYLGGAMEPYGEDLKASSHELRCGGAILGL